MISDRPDTSCNRVASLHAAFHSLWAPIRTIYCQLCVQKGTSLLAKAVSLSLGQSYWIGAYLVSKSPYAWAWNGVDQTAAVAMNCGGSATDPPTTKGCGPWGVGQVSNHNGSLGVGLVGAA